MNVNYTKILIVLLLTLFSITANLRGQNTRISLTGSIETSQYTDGGFNASSVGLSFEHQFTDRFGIVLGTEKTNYIHEYFTMSRVSLPVMAKFFSKPVNVAVGPYVDVFTGLKSPMNVTDFSTDAIYWGFLGNITHRFDITPQFSVEPGIRLRYGGDTFFTGLTASLKYTF